VLVPLYLHHRYQVEAAASAVGGQHYIYAIRGDGRQAVKPVPAAEQHAALDALMTTIKPSELALPPAVLRSLPPRPPGFGPHRELFPRNTGMAFDAITPAVVAADLVVGNLLEPARAARLVEQRALDSSLPGLAEVIDRLFRAASGANASNAYEGEIARAVQHVVVDNVIALADRAPMPQVRAIATLKLRQRMTAWSAQPAVAPDARAISQIAMNGYLADEIRRFLDRPSASVQRPAIPEAPPGAPIGEPAMEWVRRAPFCSVEVR
jgi:uncharacterized protein DUF4953